MGGSRAEMLERKSRDDEILKWNVGVEEGKGGARWEVLLGWRERRLTGED